MKYNYNRRTVIGFINNNVKVTVSEVCEFLYNDKYNNNGLVTDYLQSMVEDGYLINENGKYMIKEKFEPLEKDDLEQRKRDIETALSFKANECGEFETTDIASWKARFYKLRDKGKKYSIKKQTGNTYKIYRLA